MSLQSLFFRPQRGIRKYTRNDDGSLVLGASGEPISTLYQIDGVIEEMHRNDIKLTKHPIEFGANITDHAIKQPYIITVSGVVTNSPSLKQLGNRLPGSAVFYEQAISAFTGSRIQEAYVGLLEIQNERELMSLQTGLVVYDNMVLTKVSTPNNKENRLMLNMTFEEAIVVDDQAVEVGGVGTQYRLTTTPSAIDYATIATSLTSLGVAAGLQFLM